MTNYFFIIRGVPGSGKTTLANEFMAVYKDACHFEADMYFIDKETGEYKFDPSKLGAAHRECMTNCENALAKGRNCVIVSNTFTTLKELEPYFEMAARYKVLPLVITAPGSYQNVHGVPPEKVEAMRKRFVEDTSPLFEKYFN